MKLLLACFRYFFGLYKSLCLWRLGKDPSWQRVPAGFVMKIDPQQWLDQRMLFGVYEPWLRTVLESAIQPGDTCIDIGTHKGYFTLMMAKQVGANGGVYAFDPDPRAFSALTQNRDINRFDWIHAQSLAIGESEGRIELELTPKLGDSSRFHRREYSSEEIARVEAEMLPLDQALSRAGYQGQSVAVIKIDAEGSEPYILHGMKPFLENQSPILILEFHFECLTQAGSSAQGVLQSLNDMGYQGFRMNWKWSVLGQSVVRLVPLTFGNDEGETVDAVLVRMDSPMAERISAMMQ